MLWKTCKKNPIIFSSWSMSAILWFFKESSRSSIPGTIGYPPNSKSGAMKSYLGIYTLSGVLTCDSIVVSRFKDSIRLVVVGNRNTIFSSSMITWYSQLWLRNLYFDHLISGKYLEILSSSIWGFSTASSRFIITDIVTL